MTATPSRADLRTLAAEGGAPMTDQAAPSPQSLCDHPVYVHNIRGGEPLIVPICQLCGEIGWDDLREQMAEYRRTVLGEAADELTPPIEWQRRHYGDDAAMRDRVDWIARGRLFGMEDAQATIRLLAAAAPPAGLSATVPAGNAPAVPEGGMGACDRCTGLFLPGDKIAYDADGQYHAEHFPAVPEEADGQRAGQDDALTYAEMESERDRLAGEVFALTNSEALAVVAAELERDEVTADRDRLAAQVERVRAIHTEFDGRCAECVDYCDCIDRVTELGDDVEVAAAMRMCEHGNKPWPCPTIAAVDALPDAGTQPCPTPSDAKSDMVPLADVLDALRDWKAFSAWYERRWGESRHGAPSMDAAVPYLADRFATAPEGADERNGHGHG